MRSERFDVVVVGCGAAGLRAGARNTNGAGRPKPLHRGLTCA